tara:strand:- start:460 stop:1011 length:552 start_codon:yes stop_codon:yes gene_type:complete
MQYEKIFINDEWVSSDSDHRLTIIDPATEPVLAAVPRASATDVDRAVTAARRAFPSWSRTPATERQKILMTIADLMAARKAELTSVISASMGCPEHITGWLQVDGPIEGMRLFADYATQLDEVKEYGHSLVLKEAIGVCGFINPWNYPLHQFVGKVGAALAAGCTMVVKPSEQTPCKITLWPK